MRNVMYRNSLQSFATNSFKRTNTQFLCFLRAPRGDGTQDRNQWNEPPGAETEWSSKSELVPLSFAYPSPGVGLQLTITFTLNIKLAISCSLFWCRGGRLLLTESLKALGPWFKNCYQCTFLNSFKFQKCHTMSKYVRKRRFWQIYKVAV